MYNIAAVTEFKHARGKLSWAVAGIGF